MKISGNQWNWIKVPWSHLWCNRMQSWHAHMARHTDSHWLQMRRLECGSRSILAGPTRTISLRAPPFVTHSHSQNPQKCLRGGFFEGFRGPREGCVRVFQIFWWRRRVSLGFFDGFLLALEKLSSKTQKNSSFKRFLKKSLWNHFKKSETFTNRSGLKNQYQRWVSCTLFVGLMTISLKNIEISMRFSIFQGADFRNFRKSGVPKVWTHHYTRFFMEISKKKH